MKNTIGRNFIIGMLIPLGLVLVAQVAIKLQGLDKPNYRPSDSTFKYPEDSLFAPGKKGGFHKLNPDLWKGRANFSYDHLWNDSTQIPDSVLLKRLFEIFPEDRAAPRYKDKLPNRPQSEEHLILT